MKIMVLFEAQVWKKALFLLVMGLTIRLPTLMNKFYILKNNYPDS